MEDTNLATNGFSLCREDLFSTRKEMQKELRGGEEAAYGGRGGRENSSFLYRNRFRGNGKEKEKEKRKGGVGRVSLYTTLQAVHR